MNDATPQADEIREINGIKRRYTDGYWIRCYDPPQKEGDDLLIAVMRLAGSFEKRFLKTVEGGQEVGADADSIDRLRRRFDAARNAVEKIPDKQSYAYRRAMAKEETWGGMLAVSIFRRMISNITEHISCRIGEMEKHVFDGAVLGKLETLKRLEDSIEKDMKEVWGLFKYARRAGGEEDKDQVLMEMIGEPMKLLAVTRAEDPVAMLTEFFKNRYLKIAQCWKDIDRATEAVKTLIASSGRLEHSDLLKEVEEFSAAAKQRCETQRHDSDFENAAAALRAGRNLIRAFRPDENDNSHVATVTPRTDTDILKLVQDYRKLVYDIAHVRTPRRVSTDELIKRIDHKLHNIYKGVTIVP